MNRQTVARWRANSPEVTAAHRAFRKALRAREFVKPPVCQAAGCECSTGLHGPHPTYKQPLLVLWLGREPQRDEIGRRGGFEGTSVRSRGVGREAVRVEHGGLASGK